ncbi:MAG TPA: ABC transporter ATP-binding protein [Bacilli bacterium]|nr:ABC transporter ATP-binding protein [Bacilli bacterium]
MPPKMQMSGRQSRPKNSKQSFLKLLIEFRAYRTKLIIISLIIIAGAVLQVMVPVFIQPILNINNLQSYVLNATPLTLNWLRIAGDFGLIIGFYIVSAILNMFALLLLVRIANDYGYNLRNKIKKKLDRLPLSYFDKHSYGEILSKGTNDVDAITQSLNQIVYQTLHSISLFVGVLVAMFIINWRLALVTLATLPLSLLITFTITKTSQKQFVKFQVKTGELEGIVEENFSGLSIIQLYNQQQNQIDKFEAVNKEMTKANWVSQLLSAFIFPSIRFVNNLGFVGVSVVGGLINDSGSIAAFLLFLNMFTLPFQQLGQISGIIQTTLAGAERIFELLDAKEEDKDIPDAISDETLIHGEYKFRNVAFSYSPDKPLIENMNLDIKQGDIVAIVGPTGAGKTTLVNLVMRFYEISDGEITLDGVNIRDYKRETLRSSVGMVLQDTWIFKGTIGANIRYGRSDASEEDMILAAKSAKVHHFITTLPGGYNFVLNEDGTNISQGQRQLITIARAIISNPRILILDEATSSVDTRTEYAIQTVMEDIMKNRTTFIIAHRLSTIKNAKKIIVMNRGSIIETGTHQELLAANGFYAELYNAQFLGSSQNVEPVIASN